MPPRVLAFGGDRVVYWQFGPNSNTGEIVALSPPDGAVNTVVADAAWDLWVEGDQVIYSRDESLYSAPLGGGPATVLIDGTPPPLTVTIDQALDSSAFYWARRVGGTIDGPEYTILRDARAGGAPQQLATVVVPNAIKDMAIAPAALILGGYTDSFAIPLDGSQARSLASAGGYAAQADFVGVDETGAYYSRPVNVQDSASERFEVVRAPADGGPLLPFWTGKPEHLQVSGLWPDGRGAWFASGWERFDDGLIHLGLWWIAADGTARRAACDSRTDFPAAVVDSRPAFSTDAAYLAVRLVDTWTIVKVARD